MYAKQCLSALASAITLGLATTGYAQAPAQLAPPVPVFLSPSQILHADFRVPVTAIDQPLSGPKAFVGPTAIYNATNTASFITTTAGSKYFSGNQMFLSSVLNPFNLPAGSVGTTGATVQNVVFGVFNNDTADHPLYATIRVYDTVDLTVDNSAAKMALPPYGTLLGSYNFTVDATHPNTRASGAVIMAVPMGSAYSFRFALPTTGTPLTLTHDLGTANSSPYGYQVSVYTDATRTALSEDVTPFYQYNVVNAAIGHNYNVAWNDANGLGIFGSGRFGFTQPTDGTFDPVNLYAQIVGTTPNALTYEVFGTLFFPTLPASAAGTTLPVVWTFTGTTNPTPIAVSGTVTLAAKNTVDPNTGATITTIVGTYDIFGLSADTYNIDIQPDHFLAQTDSGVAVTTANQFGIDATFTAPAFIASGTIAFPNLVATAPAQPVSIVIHSETTNTNTTKTLTVPAAGGPFKFNLAPDKYTIWMKSPLELAVIQTGIDLTASDSTALTFSFDNSGDTDNNNTVDVLDFGNLVNAYGSKASDPTSGYDATVDFNGDASVDVLDFGLLVNSYGSTGPASP